MNIAVILAGGVGNRVGAKIPKQFIEVLGKPVLAYTIEAFEKHPEIDVILVVCIKPYIEYVWELKEKYEFSKLKWITEGGDTFQYSVWNGIKYLENKITRDDTILVHFGASPFISEDVITDCIKVCKEKGNAISTTDYYLLSGKKVSTVSVTEPENYSEEYINRETIAVMNSPHAFNYGFINDLYKEAIETGVINTVEPHTTTLMYAMGKKIFFSLGSQINIKITRKEDLELFEGYVLEQRRKKEERSFGEVVVFLADGFEECEELLIVDLLRRAGAEVVTVSIMGRRDIKSAGGKLVQADCLAESFDFGKAKLIILLGGKKGTDNLEKSDIVREQCVNFANNKMVAAISSSSIVLAELGLLKKATVHPKYYNLMKEVEILDDEVVVDGRIVTSKGIGTIIPFSLKLVEYLYGFEKANQIRDEICY